MSRITIHQFHAALADAADQRRPLRAYRELTRRSPADARVGGEWAIWPPVAALGWPKWPEVAGARA